MQPAPVQQQAVERARRLLARDFGPSRLLVDEQDTAAYRRDASSSRVSAPAASSCSISESPAAAS